MTKENIPIGKAPYNFVPLPERIIHRYKSIDDLPTHDASRKEDRNLLSGEITFNIVAHSPILVADGTQDRDNQAKDNNNTREFIKNADGRYEIPGSTLKGLIRNTVSVLSLSDWTERIDDERFYYRALAESGTKLGKHYKEILDIYTFKVNGKNESIPRNVKAGYIAKTKEGEYCIYHTKTDGGRHGKTYYKVNSGTLKEELQKSFLVKVTKGFTTEKVSFSLNQHGKVVKLYDKDASFDGWLLFSGFIRTGKTNKVSAYIINEIDLNKDPIGVKAKDIKAYKADLKFRLSKFPKDKRKQMENFFKLPDKPGIEYAKPCFYIEHDSITYFGFTAFLRLLFPHSTKDMLPKYILQKKRGIDYASALFGFTTDNSDENESNKKFSYTSRVHFHSALAKENVEPLEPEYVQPGSPRASVYRFYLKQNDKNWKNSHSYLTKETTIRGMKQYWIKDVRVPKLNEKQKARATKLKLLPKNTTFLATIRFDQLHEDELGLLLWSIKGPKYHQLGMGKPYGFGVVTFELIKCSVTNNQNMYRDLINLFDLGYEPIDIDSY